MSERELEWGGVSVATDGDSLVFGTGTNSVSVTGTPDASGWHQADLFGAGQVVLRWTAGADATVGRLTGSIVEDSAPITVALDSGRVILGPIGAKARFELAAGLSEVILPDAGMSVAITRDGVTGRWAAGATGKALFDLAIVDPHDDTAEILVPLKKKSGRARLFEVAVEAEAETDVIGVEAGEAALRWPALKLGETSAEGLLAAHGGLFLAPSPDTGKAFHYDQVGFAGATARANLEGDGIAIEGAELTMTVTGGAAPQTVTFTCPTMSLRRTLVLDVGRHADHCIPVNIKEEAWLRADPAEPFTVVLNKGAAGRLSVDPGKPTWTMPVAKDPVARVYVPGVAHDKGFTARRFEYTVAGEQPAGAKDRSRFQLGPAGLDLTGAPVLREVAMGAGPGGRATPRRPNPMQTVKTTGGALGVTRGEYSLTVEGEGDLPYFRGARAFLTGAAASRAKLPDPTGAAQAGALGFQLTPDLERTWIDQSRILKLASPEVWLRLFWHPDDDAIAATDGEWDMPSGLSGDLVLRTPDAFDAVARPWLEGLFDDLELRFAEVSMSELFLCDGKLNPTDVMNHFVPITLVLAQPLRVEMFSVFWFELRTLELAFERITVGGAMGLETGKLKFEAELSALAVELSGGRPTLGIPRNAESIEFKLSGALDLGEAFKAEVSLGYSHGAERQALSGEGAFSGKAFPPMDIAFNAGRIWHPERRKWLPIFSIFGQVDKPITLYKGVVLREWGAGFGWNMALSGLETGGALETLGPLAWVENPEEYPFPDPKAAAAWVTDVDGWMIVAKTAVTPEKLDADKPQPYVVDAILTMDERFNLVLMSNVWMFSSLDDTHEDDFRQHPLGRGVVVIYPRNLTLEAHFRTLEDARYGEGMELLVLATRHTRGSLSLFLSPDRFSLQLGPFIQPTMFGPFECETEFTAAVEWTGDAFAALLKIAMRGQRRLQAEFALDLGLIQVRAGFKVWASFSIEALFAGGYLEIPATDPTALARGGRELAVYARLRAHFDGGLELYLEVAIEIPLVFFTISIRLRFQFRLSVAFDAELEAAFRGDEIAIRGEGRVTITLMGWELAFKMNFATDNAGQIDGVQAAFAQTLGKVLLA